MNRLLLCMLSTGLLLAGCGGKTDDSTGDTSSGGGTDSGSSAGLEEGELPPRVSNAGVAYVGHYSSKKLIWVRTDGSQASDEVGQMDLEGMVHDLDVDPVNDRLLVVQDALRVVDIFQIERPTSPSSPVTPPKLLSSISTEHTPLFGRFDPYHQRLYLFTSNSQTGRSTFSIYRDEGGEPVLLGGFDVPTTAAWDIDPVRQLLFIYSESEGGIRVYDLHDDTLVAVEGSPVPIREWYPEENNWGFSVRNLRADPWSARVTAGRPQGTLSELMAFSYPDAVPGENSSYSDHANLNGVSPIEDAFDVSVPHEQRPYLLEAHGSLSDPEEGLVFLMGRAWNGRASTDLVLSLDDSLQELEACPDQDKGWCWLRNYAGGSPSSYLMSEGSSCIDVTHNVLVNTTVDLADDEGNGQVALYSYTSSGRMTPMLKADGSNARASVYPVDAACH